MFSSKNSFFFQNAFSFKNVSVQNVLRVRPDLNETFWSRKPCERKNLLSRKWSQKWLNSVKMSPDVIFERQITPSNGKWFWTEMFLRVQPDLNGEITFWTKTSFGPRKCFLRVQRNKSMNQGILFRTRCTTAAIVDVAGLLSPTSSALLMLL